MNCPYNANKSIEVKDQIVGPVTTIDFGTVVVTENWGRLFIKKSGVSIVISQGAYPAFRDAIDFFIPPEHRPEDAKRIAQMEAQLADGSFYKEDDIAALQARVEAAEAALATARDDAFDQAADRCHVWHVKAVKRADAKNLPDTDLIGHEATACTAGSLAWEIRAMKGGAA